MCLFGMDWYHEICWWWNLPRLRFQRSSQPLVKVQGCAGHGRYGLDGLVLPWADWHRSSTWYETNKVNTHVKILNIYIFIIIYLNIIIISYIIYICVYNIYIYTIYIYTYNIYIYTYNIYIYIQYIYIYIHIQYIYICIYIM